MVVKSVSLRLMLIGSSDEDAVRRVIKSLTRGMRVIR